MTYTTYQHMSISSIYKRHGFGRTVVFAATRCMQKCMLFDLSDVFIADTSVSLKATDNSVTTPPSDFAFRFVEADEVHQYVREGQLDLDDKVASRLETDYDRCFGAFCEGHLVGYCFFALDSIEPSQNRSEHPLSGVGFSFEKSSAFRYKGFVHPNFRGQRIYEHLLNEASVAMRERHGIQQMISTNQFTNFSVKNCLERMGYQWVGYIAAIGIGGRVWMRTPDLERWGIRCGTAATVIDRDDVLRSVRRDRDDEPELLLSEDLQANTASFQ